MRNIMRIATSSLVLTGGLGLAGLGAAAIVIFSSSLRRLLITGAPASSGMGAGAATGTGAAATTTTSTTVKAATGTTGTMATTTTTGKVTTTGKTPATDSVTGKTGTPATKPTGTEFVYGQSRHRDDAWFSPQTGSGPFTALTSADASPQRICTTARRKATRLRIDCSAMRGRLIAFPIGTRSP